MQSKKEKNFEIFIINCEKTPNTLHCFTTFTPHGYYNEISHLQYTSFIRTVKTKFLHLAKSSELIKPSLIHLVVIGSCSGNSYLETVFNDCRLLQ